MDRPPLTAVSSPDPLLPRQSTAPSPVNRRSFVLAAATLSSAAWVAGCRAASEPKLAHDATLLHYGAVREAVTEVEQSMNGIEERLGQFNAGNWQDALANLQTASLRMQNSIEELKRALGYVDNPQG